MKLTILWGFWNNQTNQLFDSDLFQIHKPGSFLILIFQIPETGNSFKKDNSKKHPHTDRC
jgi:hypothetical protein